MTLSNSGQIPKAPSLNTTQSGSISALGRKEGTNPWTHTSNRDARESTNKGMIDNEILFISFQLTRPNALIGLANSQTSSSGEPLL